MKYLLSFYADYCDEFDVEAYTIISSREDYDYLVENQNSPQAEEYGTIYVGFGSNEELEFGDVSNLLDCLSIEEITDAEADTICKVVGCNFGLIDPADLISDIVSAMKEFDK